MDRAKNSRIFLNYFQQLKTRPLGSDVKGPDKKRLRQLAEEGVASGIPIKKIPPGKTGRKQKRA